mmetsp:Transcript_114286/g.219921  ORF Transcript_114286/g.219921 Transcript_114286/m.219921 type:complete len:467 (+) Transcript_114286:75-1475(+)
MRSHVFVSSACLVCAGSGFRSRVEKNWKEEHRVSGDASGNLLHPPSLQSNMRLGVLGPLKAFTVFLLAVTDPSGAWLVHNTIRADSHPSLLDLGLTNNCHQPPRILICGDADFSYSRALASSLENAAIFASAYEAEPELLALYPGAADGMTALLQHGACVRCGVDARKLDEYYGQSEQFDRIIFNLPQSPPAPGARNQIQRHRALLRDFCTSAAPLLAPYGELWITLLCGQGGTPLDPIQRSAGDTWQIMHAAASAGLLVCDVARADVDALDAAGYRPTGRGLKAAELDPRRKQRGLLVHVLALECKGDLVTCSSTSNITQTVDKAGRVEGIAPLEWTFDNAFWLSDASVDTPPELPAMLAVCKEALGPYAAHVLSEAPSLFNVYKSPKDGRTSHAYHFVYRSSWLALSRERALRFHAVVCKALSEHFGFEPRTPRALAMQGGEWMDCDKFFAQYCTRAAQEYAGH